YSALRELDQKNIARAWIDVDFPENDILTTVFERLKKASS
ncbi:hypothetical protein AB751O23_DK_00010, partial [Chlamydiales bacterium SCGC AB-751-O23]